MVVAWEENEGTTMSFITEEVKETILDYSQGTISSWQLQYK